MDNARFDRLVRLAASGNRRDVLRALLVAAMAAPLAPARAVRAHLLRQGVVVVGAACATTAECRQVDMQRGAICADNGFDSDGALNCCLERGCCQSDADCCGEYRCAPTGDVCNVCARPPFPTRGIGQVCVANDDCVASVVCDVACIETRCNCIEDGAWRPPAEGPLLPAIPDRDAALIVAEQLSQLEIDGRFDALYARMHPDAQRLIPSEAVIGWYESDFVLAGTETVQAMKVRFIPWTWGVTGETYPETAEVAYRQTDAGGTTVRGEIRLVKDGYGNWSWFFGRDRAFVEEQIARFDGEG
ncbi:MAG: hypothetical protein M3Q50_13760 [Chloroflexota bacterium]|nr:hypothetical protein [Chloroflexia bacterium]MDQ3227682.1 hypothetical protein [Chloroflexota bacterium]